MRYSTLVARVLVLAGITLLTACTSRRTATAAVVAPLMVIRVRQDVAVRPWSLAAEQRGVLYGDTTLVIRKGERFEMMAEAPEGGCRIRYAARVIALTSCPWLPGFTDPQRDIFEVVSPAPRPPAPTPSHDQER